MSWRRRERWSGLAQEVTTPLSSRPQSPKCAWQATRRHISPSPSSRRCSLNYHHRRPTAPHRRHFWRHGSSYVHTLHQQYVEGWSVGDHPSAGAAGYDRSRWKVMMWSGGATTMTTGRRRTATTKTISVSDRFGCTMEGLARSQRSRHHGEEAPVVFKGRGPWPSRHSGAGTGG